MPIKNKTISFIRTKPFFWILVPIFFLIKNANIYYTVIPIHQLAELLVKYLIGSFITYLLIGKLAKQPNYKAALYSFIALSIFFFFFSFDQYVQSQKWMRPLNQYRYILPFLAITVIFISRKIHTQTTPPNKFILFLNLLLTLFCLQQSVTLIYKVFKKAKHTIQIADATPRFSHAHHPNAPNIYFLILDEYQGNKGLEIVYNYNNTNLKTFLSGKGFYTPKISRSNYNYTFFSMPSILNMRYLKGVLSKNDPAWNLIQFGSGYKLMENTSTIDFFKKENYQIINLSPFRLENSGERVFIYKPLLVEKDLIDYQTFFKVLIRKFAWEINNKSWLHLTNCRGYNYQYYNSFIKENIIKTAKSTQTSPSPKFIYGHFFIPHGPYLKDAGGKEVNFKHLMHLSNKDSLKYRYLDYIKYTNFFLTDMVEHVIQKDPRSVIIIMSDHGSRLFEDSLQYNNQFYIRIPGSSDKKYPDTIDAVNVFRLLLNEQFKQKLDYLPYQATPFNALHP